MKRELRYWVSRGKEREGWVSGERSEKAKEWECGNGGTRGKLGATVSPPGIFGVQHAPPQTQCLFPLEALDTP